MKRKLSKLQKAVVLIIITLRIVFPMLIPFYPLKGLIISILADWFDGGTLLVFGINFHKGKNLELYHRIDKTLDYYYQVILFAYVLLNLPTEVILPAIALFALRSVGFFLFHMTRSQIFFILFPNLFEYFILFILLLQNCNPDIDSANITTAILMSVILKIPQEYYLHSGRFQGFLDRETIRVANFIRSIFGSKKLKV